MFRRGEKWGLESGEGRKMEDDDRLIFKRERVKAREEHEKGEVQAYISLSKLVQTS